MEKSVTWFLILLKKQCRNIRSWLLLILMFICFALYQQMAIPKEEQRVVGIVCEDSAYGQQIYENLESSASQFVFTIFTNKEKMIRQVKNHSLECGFVFNQDFDEAFQNNNFAKSIDWYVSEQQVCAAVVRETVSAAMLQVYANQLLKQQQEYIFGKKDEQQLERLYAYNQQYLQRWDLFYLKDSEWMTDSDSEDKENKPERDMGKVVLWEIFLVLNILLAVMELHQPQEYALYYFLRRGQKLQFLMIHIVTAVIPVLIVGIWLVL